MLALTVTTSISLRTEVDRLHGMKDSVVSISPHKQNITKHSSALYRDGESSLHHICIAL